MFPLQLPEQIEDPSHFIISDNWAMSQKLDGHRVMVRCGDRTVTAYNRRGEERDIPDKLAESLSRWTSRWIFDGELIGNEYYIFDILETPQGSIEHESWLSRYRLREHLFSNEVVAHVHNVTATFTAADKSQFFNECEENNAEGVVFTSLAAPYVRRRVSSIVKHKFVSDVDCVVIDLNEDGRDNLVLGVYKDGEIVRVGKVSSQTGEGAECRLNDVVTVTCLYSTESGRLFQATKPRIRTDKLPTDCTFDQVELIKVNKAIL